MSPDKRREPLSHDRSATAWVGGFIIVAALILGVGACAAIVLVVLNTMTKA